jgi:hypothetical protein
MSQNGNSGKANQEQKKRTIIIVSRLSFYVHHFSRVPMAFATKSCLNTVA